MFWHWKWSPTALATVALIVGALIGGGTTWWAAIPPPPWLSFPDVVATYVPGSTVVKVTGRYHALDTCEVDEDPDTPNPLTWRAEVEGSGPEIVQYAPRPEPPTLELGEHPFATAIPLTAGISPDGWKVAILVTCTGKLPVLEPIRSAPVVVAFLPPS